MVTSRCGCRIWAVGLLCVVVGLGGCGRHGSPAADEALPSADTVIARYIDALGGRSAIEKLHTRTCTGREIDERPYRGPVTETPCEMYAETTGKWAMVQHESEGHRQEGFDGRIGWRPAAEGYTRDDDQGRRKIAWLLNPQGPLLIPTYFPDLVVTAKKWMNERLVYELRGDRKDAHFALYFDAQTGLLARIGYYWDISDYRSVDGVLIPHRIVRSRKGGSTTLVIDSVKHNLPIDPERFAMPE